MNLLTMNINQKMNQNLFNTRFCYVCNAVWKYVNARVQCNSNNKVNNVLFNKDNHSYYERNGSVATWQFTENKT